MAQYRKHTYIWLPIILTVYMGIMAYIGRESLRNPSSRITYIVSLVVEAIIIIVLYFILKRREKLRQERLNDIENKPKK